MDVTDSWSMEWGDGPGESEGLSIALPPDRLLVARVYGLPSPVLAPRPRTTFLCATSADDLVVRSLSGGFISGRRRGIDVFPEQGAGGSTQDPPGSVLPADRGGETRAMVDTVSLLDWLCVESYEPSPAGVRGQSSNYGAFVAEVHPDYRFVTSVTVGSAGERRSLLAMTDHRLVEVDVRLLAQLDIDPAELS